MTADSSQIKNEPWDVDDNNVEPLATEIITNENIKSEIDDIKEKIDATTTPITSTKPLETKQEEKLKKIHFKCESCGFAIDCDYKGTRPPFSKNINFIEDCYVMKDPFSPPPGTASSKSNSEYFLVIGADCDRCNSVVCAAATCSLFYRKTYCCECAQQSISTFPLEVQSKIRKIIANRTSSR